MGWGLAGTGNSSAVAVFATPPKKGVIFHEKKPPEAACWPDTWLLRKKGVIFQEKKPPEAACWPDAGLLKRKGVTSNPRIQESQKNEKSKNPFAKMPDLETRFLAGFGIRGCFISIFIQWIIFLEKTFYITRRWLQL